jgi:hypothetical protein
MGLDMYLHRRRYIKNSNHQSPERRFEISLKVGGKEIALTTPKYVIEEVGYWRKANQIHKFFCGLDGGKDECQEIYVIRDDLVELKSRCERVLADHSLAQEVLPPQSGFFFGGTEIDDYYFEDLHDTLKIVEPLIVDDGEEIDDGEELYYQASW